MQTAILDSRNFHRALWAAVGVHLLVFAMMGSLNLKTATDFPFQIVNIRLGTMGSKKPTSVAAAHSEVPVQQHEAQEATNMVAMESALAPTPEPKKPEPVAMPPMPQARPDLKTKPAAPALKKPQIWKRARGKGDNFRPVARTLEDYVKKGDAGANGGLGIAGFTPESDAQVTQRYTQVLSLWLYKFRDYPEAAQAAGFSGKALIRLRIERSGRILFYQLDRSTGHSILDTAIRDMVYRASPVPEVPAHFPGGSQLEFLIPMAFTLD